jgi:hypothetical protein
MWRQSGGGILIRTRHTSFEKPPVPPEAFLWNDNPWSGLYTYNCIDAIYYIKILAIEVGIWHY